MPSLKFHRNDVLNKYWDLAHTDPETTKGSILGQLKALDALCQELAAEKPKQLPRQLPEVDIYRATWLPKA